MTKKFHIFFFTPHSSNLIFLLPFLIMIASLQNSTKTKLVATAAKAVNTQRSFTKSISPSALNNHHIYEYNNNNKALPLFDFFAQTKPQQSYKLGHGAAGFAKKRFNKETSVYTSSSWSSVSAQVGEDAYFRRSDAIGVADGIGGWSTTAGKNFFNGCTFFCGDQRSNGSIPISRFKLGFIF